MKNFNLEEEATDEKLCVGCRRIFPSRLLTQMCINGEYTPPICGICALKLTNKIHGLPEGTMFRGEMAQQMYDDAQDYLDGVFE